MTSNPDSMTSSPSFAFDSSPEHTSSDSAALLPGLPIEEDPTFSSTPNDDLSLPSSPSFSSSRSTTTSISISRAQKEKHSSALQPTPHLPLALLHRDPTTPPSSPLMFQQAYHPILLPPSLGTSTVFSPLPLELLVFPNLPPLGVGEEDGRSIEERVVDLMRAVERTSVGEGVRPVVLAEMERRSSGRKEELGVGGLKLEEDEGGGGGEGSGLVSRGEGEMKELAEGGGGGVELVASSFPLPGMVADPLGGSVGEELEVGDEESVVLVVADEEVEDEMKGTLLELGWNGEEEEEGERGLRRREDGQGSLWV